MWFLENVHFDQRVSILTADVRRRRNNIRGRKKFGGKEYEDGLSLFLSLYEGDSENLR